MYIYFYLGQCFSQTLSLTNGEWNKMLIFPHSALVIQEPLRPESRPVTPVVSLQHLGEQRLHQRVGGDGVAVHLQVPGTDVLDTWGRWQ